MLYASRPGAVWAVLRTDLVHDDLVQESDQLLGHYGAAAHGLAHLLLGAGVALPEDLTAWGTAPEVPAAELGSWLPCLISMDGSAQLALAREFGGVWVGATTLAGQHLTVVAPSSEPLVTLTLRDDLDVGRDE